MVSAIHTPVPVSVANVARISKMVSSSSSPRQEDTPGSMATATFELDPRGDITFVVYNVPPSLPYRLAEVDVSVLDGLPDNDPEEDVEGEPEEDPEEDGNEKGKTSSKSGSRRNSSLQRTRKPLRIRASSRHLMLSCPQFERMFQNKFQEGTALRETGHVELPICGWNAVPFLILMMIIHGKVRSVPRKISLERLAEMAGLVDYYECYEVMEIFSDMWIEVLRHDMPSTFTVGAVRWLCISWVFQKRDIFSSITKIIQLESTERIVPGELPIPCNVLDALDSSRELLISQILDAFHDLHRTLLSGPTQCSYECDCMLLGALTKSMRALNISSKPELPFKGLSVKQFLEDCRFGMGSPTWYTRPRTSTPHACHLLSRIAPMLDSLDESVVGLSIGNFTTVREDSEAMRVLTLAIKRGQF